MQLVKAANTLCRLLARQGFGRYGAAMDDNSEVLATISAKGARRWMGVGALYGLAFLLIYVALAEPPELGWTVFLLVIGVGSLVLAEKMRRATENLIELTETELRDNQGRIIAKVADIKNVDRGFFAFKPSNGFLISTKTPAGPRCWFPGLWWRVGKQIGVGGVTPAAQSKNVSEILAIIIAKRDMDVK